MKISCGIFTNIAPLYSRQLWYELMESDGVEYFFYSSKKGFKGIKTIDFSESKFVTRQGKLNWISVKNIMAGNALLFQIGLIRSCLSTNYNVFIILGEMYNISSWIAALICKFRHKPVIFWGHGFYGNENIIKRKIRKMYYSLADYNLVYGERARVLMISMGFKPEKVIVVYNSLDFNLHWKLYKKWSEEEIESHKIKLFPENFKFPVIIFIGRLIKEKKIELLLNAVKRSKEKGNFYNCVIVGEGPESQKLKDLSHYLGVDDSVLFYGKCYDEEINAKNIMMSEGCVSPGNVGLTAIHSLSYGTPVITHSNSFNQGPEAEAVIPEKTGLLFDEDNIDSLSAAIDNLILNGKKKFMEANCRAEVNKNWNPGNQVRIIDAAVLNSVK